MFARRSRMRLKTNVEKQLRIAHEKEIIPILRQQEVFWRR